MLHHKNSSHSKYLFAIGCYSIWGFVPIYWKALDHLDTVDIFFHRALWSTILLIISISITKKWGQLKNLINLKQMALLLVTSALIGGNMYLFIYGVTRGFIVETSLGYFLNPLVSVALGTFVLKERLTMQKRVSIGIAGFGVLIPILLYGNFPWIALGIAATFPTYGLLKKYSTVEASLSVLIESALLMLALWMSGAGKILPTGGVFADLYLLMGSGLVTLLPLALFAAAAKRLPLSTLGMFQYMTPSIHLATGVFLYDESLSASEQLSFPFVWAGLALYTMSSFRRAVKPVALT